MKMRLSTRVGVGAALVAWPMTILFAQSGTLPKVVGAGSASPTMRFTVSSGPSDSASGQVLRTIDDPGTGQRWLLLRDESHPGGPARLVLSTPDTLQGNGSIDTASSDPSAASTAAGFSSAHIAKNRAVMSNPRSELVPPPAPALIRAGDHLSVERHSTVVDVQLDAVALGSASAGSEFSARLVIGGRIVRAIAVGQGHATFAPATEGQP